MKERDGGWMVTYSGMKFYPLDPKPEEIRFEDIAHGLSNVCRFGGQSKTFYSVAEHSVRVAQWLMRTEKSEELAAWGLVHDASEAYLGDVIRPIKKFFPAYKVVEEKVMKAVTKKLGLPWPEPALVKKADNVILACEARDLMNPPCGSEMPEKPDHTVEPIKPVRPEGAKFMFEVEFRRLFGKTVKEMDL